MEKKDVKIQGKKNEAVRKLDSKVSEKNMENSTKKTKNSLEKQNKRINTELDTVIEKFNSALKKINNKVEEKSSKKELEDAIKEQKNNFKLLVKKTNDALVELKKNIDSKKKEIDDNNKKMEKYQAKLDKEELVRQTEKLKVILKNEKQKLKVMLELAKEHNQEEIENIKDEIYEYKEIEQARVSKLKEEQKEFIEAQQSKIDNIKEEYENYKADLEKQIDNLVQKYDEFLKKFNANDQKRAKKLEDELSKMQQEELINIRQEYSNYAENLKEIVQDKIGNIKDFQKEANDLKVKQQEIEKKYENENDKLIAEIKLQIDKKLEQTKQAYLKLQENTKEQIIKLKEQNKAQAVTIKELQIKNVKLQSKIEKLSGDLKEANEREFLTEEQVNKIVENRIKKTFSAMFNSAMNGTLPKKEDSIENKKINTKSQNTRILEKQPKTGIEIAKTARKKVIDVNNKEPIVNKVTVQQNNKNMGTGKTPVTSFKERNMEKTIKDKIYEPIQIKQVAKNIVGNDPEGEIIRIKQNSDRKQLIGFFDTDDEDMY